MYKRSVEVLEAELSLGARIILGAISALFGVVMIITAPPTNKAILFYLFGSFCLCITVACFTRGRVRQFIGSTICTAVFLTGLTYLFSEIRGGVFWSDRRSQPSVFNALLYLAFIGFPAAAYVYKARFGFAKKYSRKLD